MTICRNQCLEETHKGYALAQRLWVTMILLRLKSGQKLGDVASALLIERGALVSGITLVSSVCGAIAKFAEIFPDLWCYQPLMNSVSKAIRAFGHEELVDLLALPNVGIAGAKQLYAHNIRTVKDVSRTTPEALAAIVKGITHEAAASIVASAGCMISLRAADLEDDASQLRSAHQDLTRDKICEDDVIV